MYSLLQKKLTVQADPYPHVVIEDALPWDLYEQLEREWPEQQLLATQPHDNGICYRLKADSMLRPGLVSEAWRKFTEYHTSVKFYNEVKNVFKDYITDLPNVENSLSPRGWDKGNDMIGTDCQTVMHSPIDFSSRTPHIDNPREIYAGLLYMPYPKDDSTGGEFQIHRSVGEIKRVNKNGGREVEVKNQGSIVKSVPYKRNTFVIFCNNSSASVHSVSKRENATLHRRSVNVIAEYNRVAKKSMFDIEEFRQ
jgi:hypothetical protein|tara:strand:+ start:1603 stop:2358 length:756 start_codon:yes stop_codon:yes gene_type:complete